MILTHQVKQVAGEFVQSGFDWVVEHPVETVAATAIAVGTVVAYSTGIGEVASAVSSLFFYISASFSK